jgi:hypothetical protein
MPSNCYIFFPIFLRAGVVENTSYYESLSKAADSRMMQLHSVLISSNQLLNDPLCLVNGNFLYGACTVVAIGEKPQKSEAKTYHLVCWFWKQKGKRKKRHCASRPTCESTADPVRCWAQPKGS